LKSFRLLQGLFGVKVKPLQNPPLKKQGKERENVKAG